MKCEKCGRVNDNSCKFYKEWKNSYKSNGESSREEIIVCEPCSEKEGDSNNQTERERESRKSQENRAC